MKKLAKLAAPLNWRHEKNRAIPHFYVMTCQDRLPDPHSILDVLPKGAAIILRNTDAKELEQLARAVLPAAHRNGLKVLLANDVRLAIKLGADGVHLSEHNARRGALTNVSHKPGFLVSAAAHSKRALWWAKKANADVVLLSPVFATQSHVNAKTLGVLRTLRLARGCSLKSIVLGGITPLSAHRLKHTCIYGLAAIGAWQD
ncbi:MAG: thiamine phosphate synthase [Rhodospirillaceae bacterium]|nr:MAG: thiamine phosphate synthase [Rhodospirillaceae bacterium]